MRTILGYVDGRAIWSDNVPASPGSMPIRGSLVQGGPGRYDRERTAKYQRKHVAKLKAQEDAA
jgi:hypothetical protein